MILRNKKTGVVIEPDRVAIIRNIKETDTASFNRIAANYYSLAELNDEWEDYDEKDEKEAIAMLKQIGEAVDRINANMDKIMGSYKIRKKKE